jgi:hypothetical protein
MTQVDWSATSAQTYAVIHYFSELSATNRVSRNLAPKADAPYPSTKQLTAKRLKTDLYEWNGDPKTKGRLMTSSLCCRDYCLTQQAAVLNGKSSFETTISLESS